MKNPLLDVLPPKVRKYIYAVLFLGGVIAAAYNGADGNWGVAIDSLFGALVGGLAHANTPKTLTRASRGERGAVDIVTALLCVFLVVVVLILLGVVHR